MIGSVESALRSIARVAEVQFGVALSDERLGLMGRFIQELLKWNARINLTSITEVQAVAELHILDSLSVASQLRDGATLLDIGTGGGFPGLPLAIARPDLEVRLVDRTEKKILFLKNVIARLGLGNVRAMQVRVEGAPEGEGVDQSDVVVSRAFTAVEPWFELARPYALASGRIVAMLGAQQPTLAELEGCIRGGKERIELRPYELPSGAARALAVLDLGGPTFVSQREADL